MADFTRNLAADVSGVTTVDNNAKAEAGAEPPMVQVALFSDEYGDALDAHWTGGALASNYMTAAESGSAVESGDKVRVSSVSGGAAAGSQYGIYTPAVFNDGVYEIDVENFQTFASGSNFHDFGLMLYKDANNHAWIRRLSSPAANKIQALSHVAGAVNIEADVVTAVTTFELRLTRAGNNITFEYDIGAGWVSLGTFALAIGADCHLYIYSRNRYNATKYADVLYTRITGSGYYWDDSPEADIVDSANIGGGESYAYDAGAGNTWALMGASSVEDGDGGSNKWKVGFSDNADGTGVTWDAAWRTIAQVNVNAAAGDYDGHRYLYVKWQGNSDGTQNVNATSFTISGMGGVPPTPNFSKRHANSLQITVSGVECRSLVPVGAIPGVVVLAAAGRNGPGTGMLRSTGDGTSLSWKAPGSSTWGPSVPCDVDGIHLLEDGDDKDSWLRVQVFNSFLTPGPVSARIYTRDIYENDISYDDVTAAEAAAGDVTDYEVTLSNVSNVVQSQVKAWLDAAVADLEISDDGIVYVSPVTEGAALALADIPAGSGITLYLRRTIGAAEPSDADVLNHLEFCFSGL